MSGAQSDPDEPQDIDSHVDWLTYSHEELFEMVNTRVDLVTANDVSSQWSKLSADLHEMADELRTALTAVADAWEGQAAELTAGSLVRLADWTNQTAERGTIVAGLLSRQSDITSYARHHMPPPPPQVRPLGDLPPWRGGGAADGTVASSAGGTTPSSAGGGFEAGPALVEDPDVFRQRRQELHRQAAEVMDQYQQQSRELYEQVPEFTRPSDELHKDGGPSERDRTRPKDDPSAPPDDSRGGERDHDGGGSGEQADDDGERTDETGTSGVDVPSAPLPGAGGAPAPATGQGPGGSPAATAGGPASPGFGVAPLGAGSRSGSSQESQAAPNRYGQGAASGGAAAASGGAGASARGGAPMGAMPMGAMGGAQQQSGDDEHHAPSYLEADDDLWGPHQPATPPVLGERRAGDPSTGEH